MKIWFCAQVAVALPVLSPLKARPPRPRTKIIAVIKLIIVIIN